MLSRAREKSKEKVIGAASTERWNRHLPRFVIRFANSMRVLLGKCEYVAD